jgi:hypothetical protein
MKRWQGIGLGFIISIVALIYTLHGNDLTLIGVELAHGRYIFLLPGLVFFVLAFYFRALRWRAILNYQIDTVHAFHITTIGNFLNSFLPLRLGEVARAFLTTRLNPPIALMTAASSLVVERLTDLLALLVVLLWTISLNVTNPSLVSATYAMGILAVGGLAVLIIMAARRSTASRIVAWVLGHFPWLERFKLRMFIEHLLDGLTPLTSISSFAAILLWTALSWLSSTVVALMVLYIFYDQPSWVAALIVIEGGSLAIAIPAMPGNVGPFEAAIVTSLMIVGMVGGNNTTERAIAFGVVFHANLVLVYAVLGVIGLGQEKISFAELRRLTLRQSKKVDTTETTDIAPSA